MSLQYIKKEVRKGVHFQLADEHQSFLQVDFNTLGIKDAYKVILSLLLGMIKHSQSTQSNKLAISLQYLKIRSQEGSLCFACRRTSKFLQVRIFVFDGSGQICPNYSKQEVGNIFAKSVAAIFMFYCDAKHSDILRGSSHVYCYLFPHTARLEIFCLNISI